MVIANHLLILQCFSRPTAGFTGGWGEKRLEAETCPSSEQPPKNAASPAVRLFSPDFELPSNSWQITGFAGVHVVLASPKGALLGGFSATAARAVRLPLRVLEQSQQQIEVSLLQPLTLQPKVTLLQQIL